MRTRRRRLQISRHVVGRIQAAFAVIRCHFPSTSTKIANLPSVDGKLVKAQAANVHERTLDRAIQGKLAAKAQGETRTFLSTFG